MRVLIIAISFLCAGCSANFHLKRSQFHERMAIAKGAVIRVDTVYQDRIIRVPEIQTDTIVSDHNFSDTIYVTKDRIITKVKVNVKEKTVYIKSICKADTIRIKQPIYINKIVKTEARSLIKWWWLLVAAGIGFLIRFLLK